MADDPRNPLERWTAVDRYISEIMIPPDPALDAAVQASVAAGLPPIAVSAAQGKLLHLLARIQGARSILEIGTLGGYSTIWLGRALPAGGRLVTLEIEPKHAAVARANIARAGLAAVVDLRLGRAQETLAQLEADKHGPFDLIFIDADKESMPEYFTAVLKLSRRGSVIIVDNVVRAGTVLDPASSNPEIPAIRRFNQMLAAERRVSATTLQTVGVKGHDGLAIVLVIEPP